MTRNNICILPWVSVAIMPDGNVYPCCMSMHGTAMGNVNESSLEEIWNGEKYNELRKMHITGNFPKGHKCIEKCDQIKLFEYLKKNKK